MKDFLIEAFISEPGIEALDEAILLWLAGINEVPADFVVILPSQHGPVGEFSAVITHNAIRASIEANESREFPGHSFAREGKVRDETQVLPRAIVIHSQDAKPTTALMSVVRVFGPVKRL